MTTDDRPRIPDEPTSAPGELPRPAAEQQSLADRPSVAILHYTGPPTVGGVEATIAAHTRLLAADGHAVRIVSGHSSDTPPGVTVLNNPLLRSRGERIEQVARELASGTVSPAFEAMVNEIETWLAGTLAGIDVALVHNVLTLHKNLAFTVALHRLHTSGRAPRLIAWCHDFAWRDPLYTPELYRGYPWELLKQPWEGVHYVAVSQDRRTILASLLRVKEEEVTVVPPGIDLVTFLKLEADTVALCQRLGLLAANPLLLLPARITRRKNIELAIAITAALRTLGFAPRLVVTGPPGPHNPANAAYLARLQALRDAAGGHDTVIFLYEQYCDANRLPRPVSDAMLADLFRLADALLFPSAYEGFGIPIIEAGLAGIPIFCSDIAPFREIASDAALRFGLDEPPTTIAARIASTLRADPRIALRQRVRMGYTWDAIYRHAVVQLLRKSSSSPLRCTRTYKTTL